MFCSFCRRCLPCWLHSPFYVKYMSIQLTIAPGQAHIIYTYTAPSRHTIRNQMFMNGKKDNIAQVKKWIENHLAQKTTTLHKNKHKTTYLHKKKPPCTCNRSNPLGRSSSRYSGKLWTSCLMKRKQLKDIKLEELVGWWGNHRGKTIKDINCLSRSCLMRKQSS